MAETLNIYQELIPLSNKMYDKPISQDGKFTNPVIIPVAFNSVGLENIMETVFYIKNESQEYFYQDVVISLMKQNALTPSPVVSTGEIDLDTKDFTVNGLDPVPFELAYEYSATGKVFLTNKYKTDYVPVLDDGIVSAKFSWGYDELSSADWAQRSSVLVLPHVGTSGMPDTSYKPVRMRLTWKSSPTLTTIRDYFIDLSYAVQGTITG